MTQVHDESWSQFRGSTDHDIHVRQLVAQKMLKGMKKNENNTVDLNIIPDSKFKHKWIDYYLSGILVM